MIGLIDHHRAAFGVEPICKLLPIAPSTYHECTARRKDPSRLPKRAQRDRELTPEIERVFAENFAVYGARKVWWQLRREGFDPARCNVERLMKTLGLHGVIRGKRLRTTISDKAAPCPLDRVNREFRAPCPNRLWVERFHLCINLARLRLRRLHRRCFCQIHRRLAGQPHRPYRVCPRCS